MRALRIEPVGEFFAVVGLNTLDRIGETLHTVLDELGGRIGVVFLKEF